MKHKLFKLLLVLLILPNVVLADTFSTFFNSGLGYIYRQDSEKFLSLKNENPDWFKALNLYSAFYQSRLNNFQNRQEVIDLLQNGIADIEKSLTGVTQSEKQLLLGFLGGIQASLQVEDAFFTPLKQTRRALANFNLAASIFPADAAFGSGAAHLSGSVFFDDNFLVSTILGFKPSILSGLTLLSKSALHGTLTRVEALLFLNEFYAEIEVNHKKAAVYSTLLTKLYPNNIYFNYMHGKNLLAGNRFAEAKDYLHRGAQIGNSFYPFQYDATLKEAEAYYFCGRMEDAQLVNDLAGTLFKGLDYYRLKYKMALLNGQNPHSLQALIPAEYCEKVSPTRAKYFRPESVSADKRVVEKELAVKSSRTVEDCLILLTSLNQFPAKDRDKIILTMQDFILNLDISESEIRRQINKLAGQLSSLEAKADGEVLKIRLELYHRRFEKAVEIFNRLERQHPYYLSQNSNQKRLKIWQRMIHKLNGK